MTAWHKIGFYHWIQFHKPVKYESIVWHFVETFERLQSGFGGIRYCYQKHLPNGALEFSQNSQENNYARVSFLLNLQAEACNFVKKETLAQVFSCKFCEILRAHFLQNTSSDYFYVTCGNITKVFRRNVPHATNTPPKKNGVLVSWYVNYLGIFSQTPPDFTKFLISLSDPLQHKTIHTYKRPVYKQLALGT